jgi:G:T-mismatch repair DNA endonuclease (very short patch repair protein)
MRKSMDDELLRQQIIEILQNAGSSSTKEDLNMAVMNMLKILPPPVIKLKAEESMPTSTTLFKGEIPYPSPEEYDFTFIDLFAGIGGFRLAFQKAGGRSVFSSEWDIPAQKTYEANYGEVPVGDIRAVDKDAIPAHDVLCAGFPCQPDIVLPKYKLIIDIRGCFWHCHRNCDQYRLPSANQEWWKNKLDENVLRDTKNCNDWSAKGWNVLVIWSCLFKHMNKQNGDIILNYVATYLKEIICKKQVCLELSWNDFCIRKDSLYA